MPEQNREKPTICQIQSVNQISEGRVPITYRSLKDRLKYSLKRLLSPKAKRKIKLWIDTSREKFMRLIGSSNNHRVELSEGPGELLPGDYVYIRSEEEIRATLNTWGELKGCSFMPEMNQYCGTRQQVLRRVSQFIDERDYRLKRVSKLYILDGLSCQGNSALGRCDRGCYLFWREEWLRKAEEEDTL